mmetsp:Transcript_15588/g.48519  ORF Transcript_15588/g.48519 Transcript_15588/m.48519 type:complete len:299 (+) Transcript_15588:584-1480(+)
MRVSAEERKEELVQRLLRQVEIGRVGHARHDVDRKARGHGQQHRLEGLQRGGERALRTRAHRLERLAARRPARVRVRERLSANHEPDDSRLQTELRLATHVRREVIAEELEREHVLAVAFDAHVQPRDECQVLVRRARLRVRIGERDDRREWRLRREPRLAQRRDDKGRAGVEAAARGDDNARDETMPDEQRPGEHQPARLVLDDELVVRAAVVGRHGRGGRERIARVLLEHVRLELHIGVERAKNDAVLRLIRHVERLRQLGADLRVAHAPLCLRLLEHRRPQLCEPREVNVGVLAV